MNKTTHKEQLNALRRIEGQVRGIQKMVEGKEYCVDILIQIQAIMGALSSVSDKIFHKHLSGCVSGSLGGKSIKDKQTKIKEVIELVKRFKRSR